MTSLLAAILSHALAQSRQAWAHASWMYFSNGLAQVIRSAVNEQNLSQPAVISKANAWASRSPPSALS
jgi:hypothetical protein